MANATSNPNAQFDIGPNAAACGRTIEHNGAFATLTVDVGPNTAIKYTLRQKLDNTADFYVAYDPAVAGLFPDWPPEVTVGEFSVTLLCGTDGSTNLSTTANDLITLLDAQENVPFDYELAPGSDGTGILGEFFDLGLPERKFQGGAATFSSPYGTASDGVSGQWNTRIGFNAAGVSRNNPGPNAAGALRRP